MHRTESSQREDATTARAAPAPSAPQRTAAARGAVREPPSLQAYLLRFTTMLAVWLGY